MKKRRSHWSSFEQPGARGGKIGGAKGGSNVHASATRRTEEGTSDPRGQAKAAKKGAASENPPKNFAIFKRARAVKAQKDRDRFIGRVFGRLTVLKFGREIE